MVQGIFSVDSKWQERLKNLGVTFFSKYFYVLFLYLLQSFGISEPETCLSIQGIHTYIVTVCTTFNAIYELLWIESVDKIWKVHICSLSIQQLGMVIVLICVAVFLQWRKYLNIWSWIRGSSAWISGKGGTGSPGQLSWHQAVKVQETFGQHSQKYGLIFGCFYVKPGFDDPCGSLTTHSIL